MIRDNRETLFSRSVRAIAAIGVLTLTCILGWTVWTLPPYSNRMVALVSATMPISGVDNPVTAVLLNFRGYDTLLEIGVLMLAAIGVLSVAPSAVMRSGSVPSPILILLLRVLLPFIVIVSGYLLWIGKYAPGGAFQAGAVLAAGGILFAVVTGRSNPLTGKAIPLAMGIGLLVFIIVALATMVARGNYLHYPVSLAGPLILVIEAAATMSIAIVLIIMFVGGKAEQDASAIVNNSNTFTVDEENTLK